MGGKRDAGGASRFVDFCGAVSGNERTRPHILGDGDGGGAGNSNSGGVGVSDTGDIDGAAAAASSFVIATNYET